jgi:formate dehydrogenase (NADP+) beta subunit
MEMTLIDHPPLNPYLGKEEGFTYRSCQVMLVLPISERGGNFKEVALGFSPTASQKEARRCLQCDLSLLFSKPVPPPKKRLWVEFNQENIAAVPGKEGVFQLLDEQETVIYIKGAMNLRQELTDQLELNQEAKYFMYLEDQMFSKRESEMLQHYIIEHGKMPRVNQEMGDLF